MPAVAFLEPRAEKEKVKVAALRGQKDVYEVYESFFDGLSRPFL